MHATLDSIANGIARFDTRRYRCNVLFPIDGIYYVCVLDGGHDGRHDHLSLRFHRWIEHKQAEFNARMAAILDAVFAHAFEAQENRPSLSQRWRWSVRAIEGNTAHTTQVRDRAMRHKRHHEECTDEPE